MKWISEELQKLWKSTPSFLYEHYNERIEQLCVGGSVVEFSPATRETGVRFPANADYFHFVAFQFQLQHEKQTGFVTQE